jgi:translocation and assembly module TamB
VRRAIRIALYALAGLAAGVIVCVAAALILIQTSWFHEKVRQRMVAEIENATGGRVELGSFRFDWRTLTASVRNLAIHGTEGPGEAPLFRADLIRVGLKVVSVLEKKVDLESVFVERPQVNVIVYADGHTNVPQPKVLRKLRRNPIETVLDLAIKRFNLAHGTIQAQMRRLPLNVRGENLRAQIFYQTAPASYEGNISFRDLDVKAGGRPALPIEVDARLALLPDRIEIRQARFASGRSSLSVAGVAEHFSSPQLSLDYSGRIEIKDVTQGVDLGPLAHRGAVALDGRATISGEAGYSFAGKLRASGLVVEQGGIRIEDVRADSAFAAAGGRVALTGLTLAALGGRFDGRAELVDFWKFELDGTAHDFSLQEMKLIHEVRSVPWDGAASGTLSARGEVRNRRLAQLVVNTRLDLTPTPGPNPVQGLVDLTYDHAAREIAFGASNVATKYSRLSFSGVLGQKLKVSAETTNLDDVEPAIAMVSAGPAPTMPVKIAGGMAGFQGAVVGPLSNPTVEGHAEATNVEWSGRRIDRAEADVVVAQTGVLLHNAKLSRLGVRVSGDAEVGFQDWKLADAAPVSAQLALRSPHLADLFEAAGVTPPLEAASGDVSARIVATGTVGAPVITGHLQAVKLVAGGQSADRAEADVRYTATQLDVENAQLAYGTSKARLSGSFEHPAGDWRHGHLRFAVTSPGLNLAQVKAVEERVPGIEGRLETQMTGEATIAPTGFRPSGLNGWVNVQGLALNGEPLGSLALKAATQGQVVDARLEGKLAGSEVTGTSAWTLGGNYPAHGRIEFTALQFSTLLARLRGQTEGARPPFSGFAAGSIDFSGSALDRQSWRAAVNLPSVEIRPAANLAPAAKTAELSLRNVGPVVVEVDSKGAQVAQAHFQAKDTDLNVTGRIGVGAKSPWDVRVRGGVNLTLLQDFASRMYSSGSLALDVSVRGELANPGIYGRVELKNASINFVDFPNGIDNANGTILLYRDRATIETLTARSGGGKVDVTGFVSLAGVTTFHLQAKAADVRVRYPAGISSTVNAELAFTGTAERSLLGGTVTITRVGFNLESDLGTMLAQSAQPIQTPLQPNPFLQGLRLSVHIVTAPQARFETQLTKDVEATADLRLRGDATRPVLLGRVLVNQGQVNFFGNQYTINSGQILFSNTTRIEPSVNLSLETRVRGIDVTLQISGPADKLNMSYTSDPPLPFSDVLALLTTGREPGQYSATTPTASALVGQSYQQGGGASALLSQAISSPLTGRLQRFFGVSRLKINPLVTGLTTSNAAAQITLEQNITSNLTFTYITDLSRAQAQTIQMEWDFTPNWSAVAVREENGLFGIDFLYRKQIK